MPNISQKLSKRYTGPSVCEDGGFEFTLFAPEKKSVTLTFSNDSLNWFTRKMQLNHAGEYQLTVREIRPEARYWYILEGKKGYPDPWSKYQPDGPHEASQLVSDVDFKWNDRTWRGRPWSEAVIYELHVGTFTLEGTFLAAIERLDHLQKLGISILQIMPVWTCPHGPSWGYDANYLFSVNADYGTPTDFKRFVDAAHHRGIQVVLDVIYNHLGIEGNYLPKFSKNWLSSDLACKWGTKLNFDKQGCEPVREMVVANALFWLKEYHLDGLRIDAPAEIKDRSKTHILKEMAQAIRSELSLERHIHLILENDHYTGRIDLDSDNPLYVASVNIKGGECLTKLIDQGQGNLSANGICRLMVCMKGGIGFEFTDSFPPAANVVELLHSDRQILGVQNHDLVGNQPDPQRIWATLESKWQELVLAIMCLSPSVPAFFMGDEFGCMQAFPFFCKFRDVSESDVIGGRADEFKFSGNVENRYSPFSKDTVDAAIIRWPTSDSLYNNANYQIIKQLLEVRRQFIQPFCAENRIISSKCEQEQNCHRVIWKYQTGKKLVFELSMKDGSKFGSKNKPFHHIGGEKWSAGWRIE